MNYFGYWICGTLKLESILSFCPLEKYPVKIFCNFNEMFTLFYRSHCLLQVATAILKKKDTIYKSTFSAYNLPDPLQSTSLYF